MNPHGLMVVLDSLRNVDDVTTTSQGVYRSDYIKETDYKKETTVVTLINRLSSNFQVL